MPLVSLGTVALDTVETPFGRVENALGGSGTYFSLAASFFTKSGIVSVIGEDFPEEHLKFLQGKGVDTSGVERAEGKTFHWEGRYEHDMNAAETLKTDLNVLAAFKPKVPKDYQGCKYLFLANIDPTLQLEVLDEVKAEVSLCDTMNYWIESKKDELTQVFERVEGIIINDGEAREYCGTPNLIKAGRMLSDIGDSKVIIKKGEHGALFFHQDDFFAAPGYPIPNVVDPTGAGDSFAGGTIGHLAKHGSFKTEDIKKSIVCGSVIASYVCEGFSTNGVKDKTQEDIQKRYDDFRQLVAFDHTPP
ncbi:MAG: sugar kinase [Candidatus Altiarchaeales archaeon]|nr:sugar kinase [Candidatus Altiarchaeales archaeon]MBD3415718.1 sugar kinase [Candidatus Altiarchaeales archaeon]